MIFIKQFLLSMHIAHVSDIVRGIMTVKWIKIKLIKFSFIQNLNQACSHLKRNVLREVKPPPIW